MWRSVIPRSQYWTVDRRGFTQNEERLDPAMTPPLDDDGWKAANAEMGEAMGAEDLGTRDARLAAAVELLGGDVEERKMVTVQPGSICFIHFDIFHRGSRAVRGANFRPSKSSWMRTHVILCISYHIYIRSLCYGRRPIAPVGTGRHASE